MEFQSWCQSSTLPVLANFRNPTQVSYFFRPHFLLSIWKILLEGDSGDRKGLVGRQKPMRPGCAPPPCPPGRYSLGSQGAGPGRVPGCHLCSPGLSSRVLLPAVALPSSVWPLLSDNHFIFHFYLIYLAFLVMVPDCLSCLITDVH